MRLNGGRPMEPNGRPSAGLQLRAYRSMRKEVPRENVTSHITKLKPSSH